MGVNMYTCMHPAGFSLTQKLKLHKGWVTMSMNVGKNQVYRRYTFPLHLQTTEMTDVCASYKNSQCMPSI